jgi:hypothetical protein
MKTLLFISLALAACVLPMNMEVAQQANAQHIQRMCNEPNYAYEKGFNAGLQRHSLDTNWADAYCMPDYRETARLSYQTGYQKGLENAPVIVRSNVVRRTYAPQAECRFSSDCGSGRSCRNDASGTKVCMGGGYAGDACWFGSDCVSSSCDHSSKTCR